LRRILSQLLSLASTADTSRTPISVAQHLLRYPSPSTGDGKVKPPQQIQLSRVMLFGNGRREFSGATRYQWSRVFIILGMRGNTKFENLTFDFLTAK
jgi:hypothetical protein